MGRFHPDVDAAPDSDDYLLHTVTSGSGPPMVLIHGVAGSLMVWDRLAPLLGAHFTLIRIDLLGYGHSPKPRVLHTPQRHVTAIRRTLVHHGVDAPVALVGLSMGSNLMLEYALRWPNEVNAMIGIGFPFYPDEVAARIGLRHDPWTRSALQYPVLAGLIVPAVWRVARLTPGVLSRGATIYSGAMVKDASLARYQSFRSSLLNCLVYYRLQEPLRASGGVRRLFVHGSNDQWAGAESVRAALDSYPLTDLRIVDGASHNLAVAEPARTAALILEHMGLPSVERTSSIEGA